MKFDNDTIVIDKPPSELDQLGIDITDILSQAGVNHTVVSGYVAVLLGRSRATEDIDIITEPFSETTADTLASEFEAAGYWGSAMPLDQLYETLSDDLIFRIAEDGHRVPNVELKFASDEYDRASLEDTVTVKLNDVAIPVGNLELQIAYKLWMGSQRDFEDAFYLYRLTEPMLNMADLQRYADHLGVENEYEQLKTT